MFLTEEMMCKIENNSVNPVGSVRERKEKVSRGGHERSGMRECSGKFGTTGTDLLAC